MSASGNRDTTTSNSYNKLHNSDYCLENARPAAMGICATTFFFLFFRVEAAAEKRNSYKAGLWFLSHFFTILTNIAVGIAMGFAARDRDRYVPPSIWLALVSAILGVGVVYHVALKHLVTLTTFIEEIADVGVHTVIPISTAVWWMLFEHRPIQLWEGAKACVLWPSIYGIYVLIRANFFGGFYPYPFLNLPELGLLQFTINCIGLGVIFAGLGAALLEIKRRVYGLNGKEEKSKKGQ